MTVPTFSNSRQVAFYAIAVAAGCSVSMLAASHGQSCLGGLDTKTGVGWGAAITFGISIQALWATYLKRRRMAVMGGYDLVSLFNGAFFKGTLKFPDLMAVENNMRFLGIVLHFVCLVSMSAFIGKQPDAPKISCESKTTDAVIILGFVAFGVAVLTELFAACFTERHTDDARSIKTNESQPYTKFGHDALALGLLVNFGIVIARIDHAHNPLANCGTYVMAYLAIMLFLSITALVTIVTNYVPLNYQLRYAQPWKYNVVPYTCATIIGCSVFIEYVLYQQNGIKCSSAGDAANEEDYLKAQFWIMIAAVFLFPLTIVILRSNEVTDKMLNVSKHDQNASGVERGKEQTYHSVALHASSANPATNRLKPNTSVQDLTFV